MTADELIALVSAHGVDLKRIAGASSDAQGRARKRKRTPLEVRLGLDVLPTVRGHESRTFRPPQWSVAELGIAASGLEEIPWLAARYSFAGDRSCKWKLWYALAFEAQRVGAREGWKPQVMSVERKPQFYLEELAELVLDVDAHRPIFTAAPIAYAICMRVTAETWNGILASRFARLQVRYESWLGTARSLIQQRMREEEPIPEQEIA